MSHFFSLVVHRSDQNPLGAQALRSAVQREIDHKWGSKRYRRLVFYFFEKEIIADITSDLESQYHTTIYGLNDREAQSLVARSVLTDHSLSDPLPRYSITVLINNYILGQDIFTYDNIESDSIFASSLQSYVSDPSLGGPFLAKDWSSDMLLVLRRRRADLQLINNLLSGIYGYRTLVQACGEYLAEFGMIPYLFQYCQKDRSSASFLYFLEESTQLQLRELLIPQYEVVLQKISLADPYGMIHLEQSPYATPLARLGCRWSQRPWWIKILATVGIIMISGFFGGWSLFVLPIVWGLLQGAISSWNYLHTLSRMFTNRYYHYTIQHKRYAAMYEQMIDPEHSTTHSIQSEQIMNDWYDMTPFGGHELNWDVHAHSQKIVSFFSKILVDDSAFTDCNKDFSQICAVTNRGNDHHLPLWIVSHQHQYEELYYRLLQLIETTKHTTSIKQDDELYYQYYDALSEVIGTKTLKFTSQTRLRGLGDACIVAVSSGFLGRLGSYLWNRNALSSHAFAASANITVSNSLDYIPGHFDVQLLDRLRQVLSFEQINTLQHIVNSNASSDTVWQTLTNTFDHHIGNATNTAMMDTRWKAVDQFGDSELFTQAFANQLPLGPEDSRWEHLLGFLDRIYGYDNFASYQPLIHQQWLPDTLEGLRNGTVSLSDFAQLSQEQREIVTQIAFTAIRKEDIAGLLLDRDNVDTSLVHTNIMTGTLGLSGNSFSGLSNFSGSTIGIGFNSSGVVISSGYQIDTGSITSGSFNSGVSLFPFSIFSKLNQGWTSLWSSSGEADNIITNLTGGNTLTNLTGSVYTDIFSGEKISGVVYRPFSGFNLLVARDKMYSSVVSSFHDLFAQSSGNTDMSIDQITGSSSLSGSLSPGNSMKLGHQLFSSIYNFLTSGWDAIKDFCTSFSLSHSIFSPQSLLTETGSSGTGNSISDTVLSGYDTLTDTVSQVTVITPPTQLPSYTLPLSRSKRRLREIIKNHLQF